MRGRKLSLLANTLSQSFFAGKGEEDQDGTALQSCHLHHITQASPQVSSKRDCSSSSSRLMNTGGGARCRCSFSPPFSRSNDETREPRGEMRVTCDATHIDTKLHINLKILTARESFVFCKKAHVVATAFPPLFALAPGLSCLNPFKGRRGGDRKHYGKEKERG